MAVYELVAYLHKIRRFLTEILVEQFTSYCPISDILARFSRCRHKFIQTDKALLCRIVFLAKFDCLLGFSRCQFNGNLHFSVKLAPSGAKVCAKITLNDYVLFALIFAPVENLKSAQVGQIYVQKVLTYHRCFLHIYLPYQEVGRIYVQ